MAISSRGEMGVGGGSRGGSGGGRSAGSKSVKVVAKRPNAMEEAQRISANRAATNMAAERKSGALAKITASRVNTNPAAGRTGNERITVKINSATKSAPKTKADAKAIKAANKPAKKKGK